MNWKLLLSILFDVFVFVLVFHFAGWRIGILVGVWAILWAVRVTVAVLDSVHEEYAKRYHDEVIRRLTVGIGSDPEIQTVMNSMGPMQLPDLPKDLDMRNSSI